MFSLLRNKLDDLPIKIYCNVAIRGSNKTSDGKVVSLMVYLAGYFTGIMIHAGSWRLRVLDFSLALKSEYFRFLSKNTSK